jgi:hypothetical protein
VEMSRKTCFLVSDSAALAVLRLLLAATLTIPAGAMSTFSGRNVTEGQHQRAVRFTADELLNTRFPSRISDDIDLDPCKGGKLSASSSLKIINGLFRVPKVGELQC